MATLGRELVLPDMTVDVGYVEVDLYISAGPQVPGRAIIGAVNHYRYPTGLESDDVINMPLSKIGVVDFEGERLVGHECDKFEIGVVSLDSEVDSAHGATTDQHRCLRRDLEPIVGPNNGTTRGNVREITEPR